MRQTKAQIEHKLNEALENKIKAEAEIKLWKERASEAASQLSWFKRHCEELTTILRFGAQEGSFPRRSPS